MILLFLLREKSAHRIRQTIRALRLACELRAGCRHLHLKVDEYGLPVET